MTIESKHDTTKKPLTLDLTGPDGNAFVLLAHAKSLSEQLEKNGKAIRVDMRSGDYEHLVEVFDREFGDIVTLYR